MPPTKYEPSDRTVVNIKITDDDDIEIIENSEDDYDDEENITKYVVENVKGEDGDESVIIKENRNDIEMEQEYSAEMDYIEYSDGEEYDDNNDIKKEILELVCAKCTNVFNNLKSLKKHLKFCRYTSAAGMRIAEMAKHIDKIEKESENMSKQNVCFCCEENFDTCHIGHISCSICPKSFKTQLSLERHLFLLHASDDSFQCNVCNATCPSQKILVLHVEQHFSRGKPFACKDCGKEFTRRYHVLRHKSHSSCGKTEDSQLDCHVCGKKFNRVDNLRGHLRLHVSGTRELKKNEFGCPYCERLFVSSSVLNIHIRTHTGEKPFPCDLCEKSFPSNISLKKHRRYHTGERPYGCTICTSAFAAKEVLNRHMKRHTGERPHICVECGKSFIQATQLKCHLKTHLRNFSCSSCDDKFKTQKQLEKHFKTEHNAKKRALAQNVTTKTKKESAVATSLTTIATQLPTVASLNIPLFECKFCSKTFKAKATYAKHMEMETKKRAFDQLVTADKIENRKLIDYKCTYCPKKFRLEDNFKRHMAMERKKLQNLTCDVCGEHFPNHDCLDFHKLKVHDRGNDDNVCGVCQQSFTTRAILIAHLEIKHRALLADVIPETETHPVEIIDEGMEIDEHLKNIESKNGDMLITEYVIEEVVDDTDEKPRIKREITDYFTPKSSKTNHVEASPNTSPTVAKPRISLVNESTEQSSITKDIGSLLNLLVDSKTLAKFGWPSASVEQVIRQVIANCGHTMEDFDITMDHETRMQEYVKLLFSVVVDNDSIRELLNNFPIEEVIQQVLTLAN